MTVTTVRTNEKVNALIRELAEKMQVRQADIIRGLLYTGATSHAKNNLLPQDVREHYEMLATIEKMRRIKVETNFLASNAHFVRRSAKMLMSIHRASPHIAKDVYSLLLEEAKLRGVLDDFIRRVPKDLNDVQEYSRAMQEATEVIHND